jgi:hypothetical protein
MICIGYQRDYDVVFSYRVFQSCRIIYVEADGLGVGKVAGDFWAEASVREATVTCTPALERTCTVGVATKPEPRRRADCGIVIVKDVVLGG